MRRFLFNLLAALSLLCWLAVVVAWARSYIAYEHWGMITPDHGAYIVRSANGRVDFARHSYWDHTFSTWRWEHHRVWLRPGFPLRWPDYEYQQPKARQVAGLGYMGGTNYMWPGHLLGIPNPMPPKSDPRWWTDRYRVWTVPHWLPASAFAVLPAWWIMRHPPRTWRWRPGRARRRLAAGLCPGCGYDLRATPQQCPECGTRPADTAAPSPA